MGFGRMLYNQQTKTDRQTDVDVVVCVIFNREIP